MANTDRKFKTVIAHAKEYGYVFASSEIYDGLGAVYDYGPNGVQLKKNIKDYWWKSMVQLHQNIVGLDASILMHPKTWEASGHIDAFNDPLIDNKDSKKRYRADVLIEDYAESRRNKAKKEIERAKKRFGDKFDEEEFVTTNKRVIRYNKEADEALSRMTEALETDDLEGLKDLIVELDIACPVSGSRNWTDVKQFNLMFHTKLGADSQSAMDLYLRPETAQGIFVNFLNVQNTSRMSIPFGIAQIGKAFRNEIVARQFVFRQREFEQMEMQYFVKPGEELKWFEHWKKKRESWYKSIGFNPETDYRFRPHDQMPHYANAAVDIQFNYPFGFRELEGIHSRTDYDLKAHEKHSGKKLRFYDHESKEHYIPYVVETSVGIDRLFLAVFSKALQEEDLGDGKSRTVLKLPPILAPTKAAIFPLVKRDGLPEIAQEIVNDLQWDFDVLYDDKDAVGRRYRRQDAAGTPFCITVDYESKDDQSVTVRYRDSMNQQRVKISELKALIAEELSFKKSASKIQ
ncbi:MAG TPA: glycine--tRNA ligase [Flavobacteriaceae bacterium]|nr:glycine--tRNA ligase [Flavobacteriaceae bacterium]